jgi:sulfoxide reductase catalytic subunit YedY
MANIILPKGWAIPETEATSESAYMNRRTFIKGTSLGALATTGLLAGCSPPTPAPDPLLSMSELEKSLYPANKNKNFQLDREITAEKIAASYNNFYEFSEDKSAVQKVAGKLITRPWSVEVTGLVNKPRRFDLDDLLKTFALEERLYRLRCVEAWAMAVPWTGFPLKSLLDAVEPQSKATHVRLTTFHRPLIAHGQLAFWEPWPYAEGITIQEANNKLAFLATGIYGHPLPTQHGAPLRLVLPWKYGFKSIKSIVRIELIDYKPRTFWNTLIPHEYEFTANVDPKIPHPRWSQAKETMIGTDEVRPTLPYNGYGEYVARLYK